ncbi:hypothetical protein ACFVZW_19435 [Streptomyces sp. NPDC059567]|uniref:hypothetical protein n=1 Tax=Streptomyces sp. NPDC059567 TaxID=3346867 RepID=UPI00369392F6
MEEAPDAWTLAAFWFAAAGAALAAVGSAARAWFALAEYRDLLDRAKLPDAVRQLFVSLRPALGLGRSFQWAVAAIHAVRTLREIEQAGGEDARRLTELMNQVISWGLVLWGALFAFVAALIRLISSHTSG